ncbi:hypothetical protein WJX84_005265 [Apatococcus fuscideae]|uniref:Condensin-2 complex subunit H2 n=1 Tax=Apatococcus fuscideae TaxID=2026836 RepID=A0AAW1T874_9CHLO
MAGSDESKYAHLLQPIRDLAGNWDINVADELEEYLEVLESVTFSFEDGPSLNFAEAALVIQGSACVYGKKVEYLHSLVIQALQFMSEKRRYQDKSRDSNDQTADAGSDQAEEDAFAVLDDFWQGEEDIDLDPASQAQPAQSSKPPAILLALNDSGIDTGDGDAGNYRVSKCLVHTSDHYDGGEYAHMDASAPAGVLHEAAGAPDAQLLQCASMQCMAAGPAAAQEAARAPSNDGEEELWDPYAPLNPSSPGVLAVAPFKKGRAPTNRHRSHAQPLEPEPDDAGPDDYGYDAGDGDMGPEDDRSDHGDVPDLAALELAATWMGGQWDAAAPDAPPGTSLMALDSQGPSYEDLCRAHIEAFIDAAAAAEVQTELAARVGEWQGKVCTVLEEQDARPPFDLQAYGTGLLDRLSDLSLRERSGHAGGAKHVDPVGFGAVVEGPARSRY